MNTINFNKTGGFPFDADVFAFMQNAYKLFNALGNLAGNLAIISGCELTGSTVADGVVYINGEVLPFRGTTLSDRVAIFETKRKLAFEDGEEKDVEITRYATFGGGINTYDWADFKRIKNLQEFDNKVFKEDNSVEKRLKHLEERVTKTIPIGLVAIWDRPADEIPEGWVEHTDLQGFTPVGQKKNDEDFGTLGKTLGAKEHTLTVEQMPEHHHQHGSESLRNFYGGGNRHADFKKTYPHGDVDYTYSRQNTSNTGGNQAHNNIQPSRIVRFIRFVGFN